MQKECVTIKMLKRLIMSEEIKPARQRYSEWLTEGKTSTLTHDQLHSQFMQSEIKDLRAAVEALQKENTKLKQLIADKENAIAELTKIVQETEKFYQNKKNTFISQIQGQEIIIKNLRFSLDEWFKKTLFVHENKDKLFDGCLGIHLADAMRKVIEAQAKRIAELESVTNTNLEK
jgi:predicted RNase H-like nuclease (RuvC/YqgF family)